jgi:hypothetical protein
MKGQRETIETVAGPARRAGASCSLKQLSGGHSRGCDRLRWQDSQCDPVLDLSQSGSGAAALCWRGKIDGNRNINELVRSTRLHQGARDSVRGQSTQSVEKVEVR